MDSTSSSQILSQLFNQSRDQQQQQNSFSFLASGGRNQYVELERFDTEEQLQNWLSSQELKWGIVQKGRVTIDDVIDQYACVFRRRKGYACRVQMRVRHNRRSGLKIVEVLPYPHDHNFYGPLVVPSDFDDGETTALLLQQEQQTAFTSSSSSSDKPTLSSSCSTHFLQNSNHFRCPDFHFTHATVASSISLLNSQECGSSVKKEFAPPLPLSTSIEHGGSEGEQQKQIFSPPSTLLSQQPPMEMLWSNLLSNPAAIQQFANGEEGSSSNFDNFYKAGDDDAAVFGHDQQQQVFGERQNNDKIMFGGTADVFRIDAAANLNGAISTNSNVNERRVDNEFLLRVEEEEEVENLRDNLVEEEVDERSQKLQVDEREEEEAQNEAFVNGLAEKVATHLAAKMDSKFEEIFKRLGALSKSFEELKQSVVNTAKASTAAPQQLQQQKNHQLPAPFNKMAAFKKNTGGEGSSRSALSRPFTKPLIQVLQHQKQRQLSCSFSSSSSSSCSLQQQQQSSPQQFATTKKPGFIQQQQQNNNKESNLLASPHIKNNNGTHSYADNQHLPSSLVQFSARNASCPKLTNGSVVTTKEIKKENEEEEEIEEVVEEKMECSSQKRNSSQFSQSIEEINKKKKKRPPSSTSLLPFLDQFCGEEPATNSFPSPSFSSFFSSHLEAARNAAKSSIKFAHSPIRSNRKSVRDYRQRRRELSYRFMKEVGMSITIFGCTKSIFHWRASELAAACQAKRQELFSAGKIVMYRGVDVTEKLYRVDCSREMVNGRRCGQMIADSLWPRGYFQRRMLMPILNGVCHRSKKRVNGSARKPVAEDQFETFKVALLLLGGFLMNEMERSKWMETAREGVNQRGLDELANSKRAHYEYAGGPLFANDVLDEERSEQNNNNNNIVVVGRRIVEEEEEENGEGFVAEVVVGGDCGNKFVKNARNFLLDDSLAELSANLEFLKSYEHSMLIDQQQQQPAPMIFEEEEENNKEVGNGEEEDNKNDEFVEEEVE